jgi:hypothetical protein
MFRTSRDSASDSGARFLPVVVALAALLALAGLISVRADEASSRDARATLSIR